jgi:hypothetical protein
MPPPFMLWRLEGIVGRRVTGPEPLRETSKSAMRQSVPVRKCVPSGVQIIDDGVRNASVVGETKRYVARTEG